MQLLRSLQLLRAVGIVCWFLTGAGCAELRTDGKSPLAPLGMQQDSIQIEKYSVRYPYADTELNEAMWSEIDEQFLPVEVRARLAANGFRAGVIGINLPAALAKVLRDNPAETVSEFEEEEIDLNELGTDPLTGVKPLNLLNDSKVRRGFLQTRAGHPSKIISAGEKARIPQLAVLLHGEDGRVTGRNYEKTLALFSLICHPERDGRVRMELEPELEYGEPQQRYTAGDGMFRFEFRPEAKVFNELKIMAQLQPGQTLIVAGRADKPGSLGHHFFTEQSSGQPTEQKLLLLRLMRSPGDDTFRSTEVPPAPAGLAQGN